MCQIVYSHDRLVTISHVMWTAAAAAALHYVPRRMSCLQVKTKKNAAGAAQLVAKFAVIRQGVSTTNWLLKQEKKM